MPKRLAILLLLLPALLLEAQSIRLTPYRAPTALYLDADRLYNFNLYERSRFELGLTWTLPNQSCPTAKYFLGQWSLRPYAAYSTGDKDFKYGASVQLRLPNKSHTLLTLRAFKDLERAASRRLSSYRMLSPSLNTGYVSSRYIGVRGATLTLNASPTQSFDYSITLRQSWEDYRFDAHGLLYPTLHPDQQAPTQIFTELSTRLSWAHGFTADLRAGRMSTPQTHPTTAPLPTHPTANQPTANQPTANQPTTDQPTTTPLSNHPTTVHPTANQPTANPIPDHPTAALLSDQPNDATQHYYLRALLQYTTCLGLNNPQRQNNQNNQNNLNGFIDPNGFTNPNGSTAPTTPNATNIPNNYYGLNLFAQVGFATQEAPYSRMFDISGTSNAAYFFRNTFLTISPNRFTANIFAHLCLHYTTPLPLYELSWSSPRPFLQFNALWGHLLGQDETGYRYWDGLPLQSPNLGVFEAATGFNGLVHWGLVDLGFGVAYQLCPTSATYFNQDPSQNFSFTVVADLILDKYNN